MTDITPLPLPRYSTHADFEDLPSLLFFDAYAVRVLTSDTSGLLGFLTKGLDCDFATTTTSGSL